MLYEPKGVDEDFDRSGVVNIQFKIAQIDVAFGLSRSAQRS
jgi:hypothetical protein